MDNKCPEPCPLLPRVEALEDESRHNKEAHKEIYGKLEESHTNVALIDQRLDQIKEDTEEIKATVQAIKDKPGKRWDGIVDKILCGIIGSLATAIISGAIYLLKVVT